MPGRITAGIAFAATAVVPLLCALPAHADTTPASPVVYLSDADNTLGLFGIEAAPSNDLANPHPVLATKGMNDVLAAKPSPDGTKIAALVDPTAGSDSDQGNYDLQVMALNGTGRRTLFAAQNTDSTQSEVNGFSWAGNDAIVLGVATTTFDQTTFTQSVTRNLQRVSVAGGTPAVLPNSTDVSDPAVSPDGATIAATYLDPAAPRGEVGLRTYDVASGTLGGTSLDIGYLGEPTWSPDGTTIAYVKDTSTNAAFRSEIEKVTRDPATSTWSAPADVVPTEAAIFDENPSFAPDGTMWLDRVDTASATPKQSLWTVAADGTALTQVLSTAADVADPSVGAPDATAPGVPAFTAFTLAGTKTTLAWTPAAADPGLYYVITRNGPDGTRTWPVSGTSYVDSTVLGATYTYTVAAVDAAGNTSAASAPRQATALTVPHIVVASPTSSSSTTRAFPLSWAGAGNPVGTSYDVRQVTAPSLVGSTTSTTATHATINGVVGATYSFSARAVDAFGNATAFTPWTSTTVPYDQTSGSFSKGWVTLKSTALWLGSEAATVTNGAVVTFTVTSKSAQVIGDKFPSGASFRVYVGSTYRGTVSTAASSSLHRQVLWSASLGSAAKRTITLVAVVAKGKTLHLDGLAAAR